MNEDMIPVNIRVDENPPLIADLALIVPFDAPTYPNTVVGLCAVGESEAKLNFHALSQIALVDFEDGVIEPLTIPQGTPVHFWREGERPDALREGVVIARDMDGKIHIITHDTADTMRLVRFANRYCTRQVRLDI